MCVVNLQIPTAGSLKDKRRVIKSLIKRIQNKFNVSIAEIGYHDAWGIAELGIAFVSTDGQHAHAALTKVVDHIDDLSLDYVLADYTIEIW